MASKKYVSDLYVAAAMCVHNRGIGLNGHVPWRIPSEMRHFAYITMQNDDRLSVATAATTTTAAATTRRNVVLMGRRTWDSIPRKHRPLIDRINIILTSRRLDERDETNESVMRASSWHEAMERIDEQSNKVGRVWVIGGTSLYERALSSDRFKQLYLTKIHGNYECDTFFPALPRDLEEIDTRHADVIDEENDAAQDSRYSCHVYVRRKRN